jgi:hypothetical protein
VQRLLDGVLASIATVLIVFSVVFTGSVITWLAFALALGFLGVALVGMTLHEVESWMSTRQAEEVRHLSSPCRPVEAEARPATLSQAA